MLELPGKAYSNDSVGIVRGGNFQRGNNPALTDFLAIAQSTAQQRQQERWAIAGLLGLSVVSLVGCVVGTARIPLNIRTGLMTVASGAAICAYVAKVATQGKDALYAANDKLRDSAIGDQYQYGYAAPMKTMAQINAEIATYETIKRTVPEAYQPFALKRANLHEVEAPALIDMSFLNGAIDVPATHVPSTTFLQGNPVIADLTAREDAIDYSWVDDPKFVRASKAIFAPKGSGKSFLVSYLAAKYVQQNPNGILWIVDPHFNEHSDTYSNDPDDQETVWLNGIPKKELYAGGGKLKRVCLVKKLDDSLRMFKELRKILKHRIDNALKKEAPVHLICDEFENRIRDWSKEETEEVLKIIAAVEDEGRKFGVTVTVIAHSIKKMNTGIDSSVIFQMNLLALGGALADTTIAWPSDMNAKDMAIARNEHQKTLNPKRDGYAAVLRRLNNAPELVTIPVIDPYQFDFSLGGTGESVETGEPEQPAKLTSPSGATSNWMDTLERKLSESGAGKTVDKAKAIAIFEREFSLILNKDQQSELLKALADRGWDLK